MNKNRMSVPGRITSVIRFSMVALSIFGFQVSGSYAQNGTTQRAAAPGAPAGSQALSGFETINPYSGNLNFSLPLLQVTGRGGMTVPVKLTINQKWTVQRELNANETGFYDYVEAQWWNDWFSKDKGYSPGMLVGRHTGTGGGECPDTTWTQFRPSLTRLTFTSPDGTEYDLIDQATGGKPLDPGYCNQSLNGPSRGTVFVTTDGSRATFISDETIYDNIWENQSALFRPAGYLMLQDGTRYRIDNGRVSWQRDRNGNKLMFAYESSADQARIQKITDSLNREITFEYEVQDVYPYGLCDKISYKGFGGASRTIRISYKSLGNVLRAGYSLQTGRQLFPNIYSPPPAYPEGFLTYQLAESQFNPDRVATVWLPDGVRSYQFTYNSHGELARVVLPTGGAVEYDWADGRNLGSGRISANDHYTDDDVYRRIVERRTFSNGSTLESRIILGAVEWLSDMRGYVLEDRQDANGNLLSRLKHFYYGIYDRNSSAVINTNASAFYTSWKAGREYQTELISSNGSTVLRRLGSTWNQPSPTWYVGAADHAPANNPTLTEKTTSLVDTNQVSKETLSYDQQGNLSDIYSYDYGIGGSGSLLRRTHTDYLTTNPVNGADYTATNIHIRSLPTQQQVFDAGGVERSRITFEYDNYSTANSLLLNRSSVSGFDSSFGTGYSTRGNVTAITSHFLVNGSVTGSVATYARYDIAGNVVKAIDGRGYSTEINYDDCFGGPDGNSRLSSQPLGLSSVGQSSYVFPTSIKNPLDHISFTQFDYNTGTPVDIEDVNGIVTSAYSENDSFDRTTKIIRAVNTTAQNQTVFTYDDASRVITTTNDLSNFADGVVVSDTRFDGLGRTSEVRQYEGGGTYTAVQTQYDSMSRVFKTSSPFRPLAPDNETPVWTLTGFDPLGRVSTVTTSDGAVVTNSYSGNVVTVTDQAGKKRKSVRDSLGRFKEVYEDPTGVNYLTSYNYDVLDNLISLTQGEQTRTFVYDSLKRLTSATNPESGMINYQYDNNGNQLVKTDARNVSTHYNYDALNRPTRRWYNGSTMLSATTHNNPVLPAGVVVTEEATYSYDATSVPNSKGRLTSLSSNASTTNYTSYDSLGSLVTSNQVTDGQTYLMSYAYNRAGSLISVTYPSGRVIETKYDLAGRIAGVRDQQSGIYYAGAAGTDASNRIQYAPHGAVRMMRLGNGLWEHTIFNNRLQPTEIGLGSSGTSSSIVGLNYNYGTTNNNGNLLSVAYVGGGLSYTQSFGYDSLNRLTTSSESGASWSQTNTYDRYGNRSVTGSGLNISAGNNRITNAGYQYDSAGNLTSDAVQSFAFDADNKIRTVSGEGDVYRYDVDGNRVRKNFTNGEKVRMVYSGGQLLAEYDLANGALKKEYVYGAKGLVATVEPAAGTKYTTLDHLGTPRVISGSTGSVISRHDYMPFGEEIGTGIGGRTTGMGFNVADALRQKFTSYERDNETGLDYAQARYYSSSHGRFNSPDQPLFDQWESDPQSWNLYAYVRNNPLNLVDPCGMGTECPRGWEGCLERDGKFYWKAEDGNEYEIESSMIKVDSDDSGVPRDFGGPNLTVGEALQQQKERRQSFIANNIAAAIGYGIGRLFTKLGSLFTSSKPTMVTVPTPTSGAVPALRGANGREMLQDAQKIVNNLAGTPAEKADLLEKFTMQIMEKTGAGWNAGRSLGADGSHVFMGRNNELLVISPQGQLFRGTIATGGGRLGNGGVVTPIYEALRKVE